MLLSGAASRTADHKHEFITLKEIDIKLRQNYQHHLELLNLKLTALYAGEKQMSKNYEKIEQDCCSMRAEVERKTNEQV